MPKDPASLAPSDAPLINRNERPEQGQSLLGRPIERDHDNLSNVMLGDGGAGFNAGSVGANLPPPMFTDGSLVRIPIRMSDVYGPEVVPVKKKGLFKRSSSSNDEMKMVMMARGDYLRYWLKGEDGKFAPDVEEPPEGRQKWFERQLELNEEWIRKHPSLRQSTSILDKWLGGVLPAVAPTPLRY